MQKHRFSFIGERLLSLRDRIGLSQADFAKKIDVPFRTYQRYEAGLTAPKDDALIRIASIFGVSVQWILTGKESLISAGRVAEAPAVYRLDTTEEKVVKLMTEMSEEEKKAVLKHAQTQRHLVEELKKVKKEKEERKEQSEPDLARRIRAKRPRPVPIDFSALERYALHLYELAEEKGIAHKLDEVMERLLADIKEQQDQEQKKTAENDG